MKTPEQIVAEVFDEWKRAVTPAWGDGTYMPSEDQFAEMVVQAIEADRIQRKLPYDTAELQGALDNNDPVQLLEVVNDIHTYQFYIEEEEQERETARSEIN